MHKIVLMLPVVAVGLVAGCREPVDRSVIGGAYTGYVEDAPERPVVQESVEIAHGYTVRFWAYDLGDEARFVAYAQRERGGPYYSGIMRLSVQDPDGDMFVVYRNLEAEPVDLPVIWKPRVRGDHQVQLEFDIGIKKERVSFTVPLVREPAPVALLAALAAGTVIAIAAVGFFLRKRRKEPPQQERV